MRHIQNPFTRGELSAIATYLTRDAQAHIAAHGMWACDPGKLESAIASVGAESVEAIAPAESIEAFDVATARINTEIDVAMENILAADSVDAFADFMARPEPSPEHGVPDSIRYECGYCSALVNNRGGVNVPESSVESYLAGQAMPMLRAKCEASNRAGRALTRAQEWIYAGAWAEAKKVMGELADMLGADSCPHWQAGVGEFHSQQGEYRKVTG